MILNGVLEENRSDRPRFAVIHRFQREGDKVTPIDFVWTPTTGWRTRPGAWPRKDWCATPAAYSPETGHGPGGFIIKREWLILRGFITPEESCAS